jgi:transcriptional regulator
MDEVPYGALDLMVLRTLDSMGPQHGYGIARRIEQLAEGMLSLNQGTIYPALLRLEQKGWIASQWGTSENNRRARFYAITRAPHSWPAPIRSPPRSAAAPQRRRSAGHAAGAARYRTDIAAPR